MALLNKTAQSLGFASLRFNTRGTLTCAGLFCVQRAMQVRAGVHASQAVLGQHHGQSRVGGEGATEPKAKSSWVQPVAVSSHLGAVLFACIAASVTSPSHPYTCPHSWCWSPSLGSDRCSPSMLVLLLRTKYTQTKHIRQRYQEHSKTKLSKAMT